MNLLGVPGIKSPSTFKYSYMNHFYMIKYIRVFFVQWFLCVCTFALNHIFSSYVNIFKAFQC